jgi:rare lipoprotein A
VADVAVRERGLASWYGRKFHGRRTASGEVYDMFAMSAAHKTMPIPSYARVRNPANGREVVVRVNDRGPFHAGRIIDLSYTAALKLGVLAGVAPVEVERLTHDDIRSGLWQRQGPLPMPQPLGGIDPLMALAERADAAVPLPNPAAPPEAPAQPAPTKAAAGYWLQLGAFSQREGALAMRQQVAQQLDWLAPLLAVFTEKQQHRLQAGPYASREQAAAAAARLREAGRVGVLVLQRTAR